jgi:hypothetical protein
LLGIGAVSGGERSCWAREIDRGCAGEGGHGR